MTRRKNEETRRYDMEIMTLKEYKESVEQSFRKDCKEYPEEEVDQYLKEHDKEIEESYWTAVRVSLRNGKNQVSPSGKAYAMWLDF